MTDTSRLETLEFKTAFLEQTVQELSDVLHRQQQELDRVREQQRRLVDALEKLSQHGSGGDAADEGTPPHW